METTLNKARSESKLQFVIRFNDRRMFLVNQRSDETEIEFIALIYGYVMGLGNGWDCRKYTSDDAGLPNINFYDDAQ